MVAEHVVKSHFIKQNRWVGLSLSEIISIIKMILFDNHCVLISELKWDKENQLQPEPYVICLFLYNVFITKSLLKCM